MADSHQQKAISDIREYAKHQPKVERSPGWTWHNMHGLPRLSMCITTERSKNTALKAPGIQVKELSA